MNKPKCQECGKSDKVVKVRYGTKKLAYETDWECERCYCVVEVIKNYCK